MRKKVKTEASSAVVAGGNESNEDHMDVDGGAGAGGVSVKEEINGDDGGMVFTSTTEFTSRLEVSYLLLVIHELSYLWSWCRTCACMFLCACAAWDRAVLALAFFVSFLPPPARLCGRSLERHPPPSARKMMLADCLCALLGVFCPSCRCRRQYSDGRTSALCWCLRRSSCVPEQLLPLLLYGRSPNLVHPPGCHVDYLLLQLSRRLFLSFSLVWCLLPPSLPCRSLSWTPPRSACPRQATLQERKRDSIKAAEKHKVKEELKQEAKAAKQSKHGGDAAAGADRGENGGKEEGEAAAASKAEAAKAKRSRWVIYRDSCN